MNSQGTEELLPTKKLTPKDFKGQADESVNYLAQTSPVISLGYSAPTNCAQDGKVKLKVETGVSISERSWIKLSKIRTTDVMNTLLSHEQGHYDLGVIFSMELKRTLSGICFNRRDYKRQVDSIFKSMYARYDSLQKNYDTETDHMRNRNMQLKWKQKIAAMWEQYNKSTAGVDYTIEKQGIKKKITRVRSRGNFFRTKILNPGVYVYLA